jgi:hypothetical protein
VQGVLPDPNVKDRVSKLCVGLASDCDKPEGEVQKLLAEHLGAAGRLPVVAFITRDLKWVDGYRGYKDAAGFLSVLAQVEKSPVLDASPGDAKKLETLAAQADKALEKEQWANVMAAWKGAAAVQGNSPLRARIEAAVAKARVWADGEMTKGLERVKAGGDRNALRAVLKKVTTTFAGEPEQKEADLGVRALDKLSVIEGLAAEQQAVSREKAAKDFAGTRWSALFAFPDK